MGQRVPAWSLTRAEPRTDAREGVHVGPSAAYTNLNNFITVWNYQLKTAANIGVDLLISPFCERWKIVSVIGECLEVVRFGPRYVC